MPAPSSDLKNNLSQIKRIIGVYSGKGGVGKTTVAVNLAALLAQQGYRTCLLDADIDCPNVNHALGITSTVDIDVLDHRIIPVERFGMKILSMASFQKSADEAIIWRGPMVTDMLLKFFGKTAWGSADYMIVDLPPGTSDVPISILNFVKPHGIVLVTTPRSIAQVDARKSANLAKLAQIPILGVVENMSGGPFGTGAGERCAKELLVAYLGGIPFDPVFLSSLDCGLPAVLSNEESREAFARVLHRLQESEASVLGQRLKHSHKGPLQKAKNLFLDMKGEFVDRYKSLTKER